MKSTKKCDARAKLFHLINLSFLFFDILVTVADVVAKAPYWFTLVPVNVPDF